ncbi:MAG: type II toxin-antitoxin system HipA family toxin [Treponema sp.]|nr:type II toxin-antitoxin system HipA family toxin [Treponema sp.]
MSRTLNVYLCGRKAGVLSEDDLRQLSFRYDSGNYRELSVALPVRAEEYTHAFAYPFFENLTPEGEAFDLLTKDHAAGNKTFTLLDRFGGDCAGAVAFYETGPGLNLGKKLYEITPAKMTQIIDRLPQDPLLTGIRNPPRLSLAGAQMKFAVYVQSGRYYRSDDENPTTHIIKIPNSRFPFILENELFCMKLAQMLELDIPKTEIKTVNAGGNKRTYLEIERYDRHIEKGSMNRIHQEDFCQALGITSDRKYQAGGGASIKDCFRIIEKFSVNQLIDITRFTKWIIYNYLIGNTDAHAKNLALLHTESGIRLAPFYDLLSIEIYPEKLVDHSMAMLINGKGKYASLRPKDFTALFGTLGLNATNMMKSLGAEFAGVVSNAENLRDSLPDIPIYDQIISIIKRRWTLFATG